MTDFKTNDAPFSRSYITKVEFDGQDAGGALWMWGSNSSGQIGRGTDSAPAYSTPTQTLASGITWKEVSCGSNHVVAIAEREKGLNVRFSLQ